MLHYIHKCLVVLLLVAQTCVAADSAKPCYNQRIQGSKCGVAGIAYYYDLDYTQYYADVSSIMDCRTLCFSNYCSILAYDSSTQNCTTIAFSTLSNTHFTSEQNSSTLFYNFDCFYCTYSCPPPEKNMLGYPGFENPLAAPSGTDIAPPWALKQVDFNNSAGGMLVTGDGSAYALSFPSGYNLQQYVYICPTGFPGAPSSQQRYKLEFAYQLFVAHNLTSSLTIGFGDTYFAFKGLKTTPAGTWANFTDYFVLSVQNNEIQDNRTYLYIDYISYDGLEASPRGNLTVDNFSLLPVFGEPDAEPSATELLANGGFETGQLAPWIHLSKKSKNDYAITSPGSNGSSYALTIADEGGIMVRFAQRMISLEEGQLYQVQYYSKLEGPANCTERNGGVIFNLDSDSDVDEFYGAYGGDNLGAPGVWSQRGFDFVATSSLAMFEFLVQNPYQTGCRVSVDGFSLKMV